MAQILATLSQHFYDLVTDAFGNYVLQHVMEHGRRKDKDVVIEHFLRGGVAAYATNKFASNVVEKALKAEEAMVCSSTSEERDGCERLDKHRLGCAIVGKPEESNPPILTMALDRYANHIVLRMLTTSPQPLRAFAMQRLSMHRARLANPNAARHVKQIVRALGDYGVDEAVRAG